jgi:hypothetical protein
VAPKPPARSAGGNFLGRGPRDLAFKQAYEIYHKCRSDSQKDPDSLNLLLQTKKELLASPAYFLQNRSARSALRFVPSKGSNILKILGASVKKLEPEFWSDASRPRRRDAKSISSDLKLNSNIKRFEFMMPKH